MAQATRNLRLTRARQGQRGFALLFVFLMASIVAITLYMEIPRVAMQTERAKEQLLIDRGEQYKRAIQLFTKAAKHYPGDIKELESFQNMRFLRHRYIDPMTGKDEWRIIHINGGILTDSKLTAPKGPGTGDEKKDTTGQFIGVENSFATAGGNPNMQGGAATVRDRRRPGEGSLPGNEIPPVQTATGGAPPNPGVPQPLGPGGVMPNQFTPGQPGGAQFGPPVGAQFGQPGGPQFGQPGSVQPFPGMTIPGQPANIAGGRQQPGAVPPSNAFVGVSNSFAVPVTTYPTATGVPNLPGQIVYPGQQLPGQPLPGQPGVPVNSQFGGAPVYPGQVPPGQFGNPPAYPTNPGANGVPPGIQQPGATAGAPNQTAADLIGRILTTPRAGGMPTGQTGAQTLGGGIAGVASNAEGEGIMVYNDHTLYQEWEFVYDPQKQKQIPNPNASVVPGTPAQQLGTPAGGQPGGQPGVNPTNPFGQSGPRPPGK